MAVLLAGVASTLVVAGPAPEAAALPSAGFSSDWNGDGTNDVIADDVQGRLWLYPGDGYGGFRGARQQIGSGWQTRDEVRPVGDWNGDGHADLVARDTDYGDLLLYLGDGSGGFLPGHRVMGRGWHVFREIIGLGDWTGDGRPDIAGLRRDTGALVLYPGDGTDGFLASRQIGAGWGTRDALTTAGDWDYDGDADLLARNPANGDLWLYRGNGTGGFESTAVIGRGWQVFTALVGVTNFTGDAASDVLARKSSGELLLYRGSGPAGFTVPPTSLGAGWNALDLNAPGVMAAPAGTAAAALAALPVARENRTGFRRDLFPFWIDADRDCQKTRDEVMIAEAIGHLEFTDIHRRCVVFSASFDSYVDGARVSTYLGSGVVSHTVTPAEAWESGARTWTTARRRAFANDLGYAHSLAVISSSAAGARGAGDPAQWQPPLIAARCGYAARWVAVKHRWRLSVDPAERTALSDVLTGTCGLSRLTLPPRA